MATNLALDDKLLDEAMKLGALRTKRETVNTALREFVDRRKQKRVLDLEGGISFRQNWNYKEDRKDRGPRR